MRRHVTHAISDDELIARYAHVLGTIPDSVAEKAYAAAFRGLPEGLRDAILDEILANMPESSDHAKPADAEAFAVFMRNLHARDAIVRVSGAGAVAAAFISSPPVVAYFTTGAGSVDIDQQPPWIHDLAGHETAPIDGGRINHRMGVNSGIWFA